MAGYTGNLQEVLETITSMEKAEKFDFANKLIETESTGLNPLLTHPYFTGVRNGGEIPVLINTANYGMFKSYDGCEMPQGTLADNWKKYKWIIGDIGEEVTICTKDFEPSFNIFWNQWIKQNEDDLELASLQHLKDLFQQSLLNAITRNIYYGDVDSSNALINNTDGFIKQMQLRAYAEPEKHLVVVSENSATTVAGQKITDGQRIYDLVVEANEKFTAIEGVDVSKGVIRMNSSLLQTLVNFLNRKSDLSQYDCGCINVDSITGARRFTIENTTLLGYKVEAIDFDRIAVAAGSDWYKPATGLYTEKNVIILAEDTNMLIGIEIEETANQTVFDFDKRKREIYFQGFARFGAGVPTDKFVIALGAPEPTPEEGED